MFPWASPLDGWKIPFLWMRTGGRPIYPLVMTNSLPWEMTHRNRWFTYSKWVDLSMAMLNNQMVYIYIYYNKAYGLYVVLKYECSSRIAPSWKQCRWLQQALAVFLCVGEESCGPCKFYPC